MAATFFCKGWNIADIKLTRCRLKLMWIIRLNQALSEFEKPVFSSLGNCVRQATFKRGAMQNNEVTKRKEVRVIA